MDLNKSSVALSHRGVSLVRIHFSAGRAAARADKGLISLEELNARGRSQRYTVSNACDTLNHSKRDHFSTD